LSAAAKFPSGEAVRLGRLVIAGNSKWFAMAREGHLPYTKRLPLAGLSRASLKKCRNHTRMQ
jgi:hypothetical protein